MATGQSTPKSTSIRNLQQALCRFSTLCLFTIICSSLLQASASEVDHVPNLKDIFGEIPKHSLPLRRTDSPNSPMATSGSRVGRTLHSDAQSSSERSRSISLAMRRELSKISSTRSSSVMNAQVSQTGFSPATSPDSEYYVKLQIGTPVQDLLLLIDTGSPLLWVQSKQCIQCFPELLPIYDPEMSSTFKADIANGSLVPWGIGYGDGSETTGIVAQETLTIDSGYGNRVVLPEFFFGLALNDTGLNSLYSGIMGLTRAGTLLTQLGTIGNGTLQQFSEKFRYCFPDRVNQPNATSFLSFGNIDDSDRGSLYSSGNYLNTTNTVWTPLLPNPTFYTINLTGIAVAGTRLAMDPAELGAFSIETGTYTILDSGTPLNMFREPLYSQIVGAYYNATTNFPGAFLDSNQLVFNMSKDVFDATIFPSMSFFFQKWESQGVKLSPGEEEIELVQPKDNLFIPYLDTSSNSSTVQYVLNFAPANDNTTIIGNYAQENFLIEFDLEENRVGFLRASCSFEY